MTMNPVGWFEIYVSDMNRAKKFYEAVFNLELSNIPNPKLEMWAFPMDMEKVGAAGALCKMEGVEPGGNSVLIYFNCEDCENEQNKVESAGGKVIWEKFAIGEHGFISIIIDSEGNTIGLHSMK